MSLTLSRRYSAFLLEDALNLVQCKIARNSLAGLPPNNASLGSRSSKTLIMQPGSFSQGDEAHVTQDRLYGSLTS